MHEYVKVCHEWPDPQEGNFQLLQIFTGLRRGEVRKLRWDDINWQTGFITLRDPKGGEDVKLKYGSSPYVFAGEKCGPRGIHQIENS
jgi:integrase